MPIGNLQNKCYYCKREKATHKAKLGQFEITVCKKCGEKLKKTMEAELVEIIDPRTKEGKERIKEMQKNNSKIDFVSSEGSDEIKQSNNKTCYWRKNKIRANYGMILYTPGCKNQTDFFNNRTLEQLNYSFCPYCGGKIVEE